MNIILRTLAYKMQKMGRRDVPGGSVVKTPQLPMQEAWVHLWSWILDPTCLMALPNEYQSKLNPRHKNK